MNRFRSFFVAAFLAAASLGVSADAGAQSLPDFTGLVADNAPAVVSVSATRTSDPSGRRGPHGMMPFDDDDLPEILRRYFGQPGGPAQPRESSSLGTGFIISADGYLLTNHHVIDGADEIHVRLNDKRELPAKLVGSDEASDVALLKLDAKNLPTVKIGDSASLKPGQWVVAIGSPFGFDHSVTAGIVSAVGRSSQMQGQQYVPFIQTDVAINPGNSGGPLLDTSGKVVGINSQIFSNTRGYMGVSFAIPIETAMRSVEQLKKQGYVSRGLLGVRIQNVDRDAARALGLPSTAGALVFAVEPGGAADKAGVKVQDVILEFDGKEVAGSAQLPPLVGATAPGQKTTLKVFRDGKTLTLPITVGELPRDGKTQASSGRSEQAQGNKLGIVVESLSADQRRAMELADDEGVVISRVAGRAAQRAGLRPGDMVLMVGKTRIGDVAAFEKAAAAAKAGEPVMLLVRRGETTQFVTLTPDAEK